MDSFGVGILPKAILSWARYFAKCFPCIISLNYLNNSMQFISVSQSIRKLRLTDANQLAQSHTVRKYKRRNLNVGPLSSELIPVEDKCLEMHGPFLCAAMVHVIM